MALTQIDLQYQSKDQSLTTEKIKNGAVTNEKLAGNISISKLDTTNADFNSSGKIKSGVITNENIAANAGIEYSKLNIPDGALTIAKTNGLQAALDSKLNLSGGTLTGNLYLSGNKIKSLGDPVDALDAVNKTYVDNLISGLSWKEPVKDVVSTLPSNPQLKDRYLLNSGANVNKIAEWNGNEWVYYTPEENWAIFVKNGDYGLTYDADSTNSFKWVQFTGAGQINAGVGLQKDGNTLSVRLGAGITELPTGEVGIDLATNSGLELVPDEGSAAELKVKVDNSTIRINSNGQLEVIASNFVEKTARERFVLNGSQNYVDLSGTPIANREILVYLDGLLMWEGANEDYTYNSNTKRITFNFTPEENSKVQVIYTTNV